MSIMRMSKTYCPTLKEDPAGADIASHKLLLRAGMIRQMGSGTYTFLPLGMTVLNKVQDIVREEMNATGAQEILMPILQPAELWHESGRWDDYGPELMRLNDRHERELCLGPTHEELITSLVRDELRSYKDLPCTLWQMQVKFRDEMRPRFGLFRTREFVMKDAYSFNADEESLDESYRDMEVAYARVCERLGLEYRMVEADSGQIGGSETCEFMALADAGESDLVHCTCGFAADAEAANVGVTMALGEERALEKIATPGVHTIADLAAFLDVPENATVKALSGTGDDGRIYALFIPGDHELNDIKAEKAIDGWRLLTDEEMLDAGLHKGSMGPVDLPDGVVCICDAALEGTHAWAVGANEDGYHFLGAEPGRDFTPDAWVDLVLAKPGDLCPACGQGALGFSWHRGKPGLQTWHEVLRGHERHVYGCRWCREALRHGLLRHWRDTLDGGCRRAMQRRERHVLAREHRTCPCLRDPLADGRRPCRAACVQARPTNSRQRVSKSPLTTVTSAPESNSPMPTLSAGHIN